MKKKQLHGLLITVLLAVLLIAAVGSFVIGRGVISTDDPRPSESVENETPEAETEASAEATESAGASETESKASETKPPKRETRTEPETVDPLSVRRIWVGDSRIVGLTESGLGDPDKDIFIGKNGRYYVWFYNDALPVLRSYLDTGEEFEVIIQIGINDCANKQMHLLPYYAEDYAELINSLIDEYENARFWFLSVGEVIGTYGGGTRWEVKMHDLNPLVGPFNQIMKEQCLARYLSIGERIKAEHRSYRDNVHYSDETNEWLYGYVMRAIVGTEIQIPTEEETLPIDKEKDRAVG